MISFWIDYGTQFIGGTGTGQKDAAWLVPLCLQLVPAVILGAGMMFMPFSPRWLEHHGRSAEARKTLASLRGLSQDHELIELEYMEIRAQSLFEKRTTAEHFPALADGSAMSTIKLQFVAIGSLFTSMPMFRRVCTRNRYDVLPAMDRNQCYFILCAADLQRPGTVKHGRFTVGHWCGWHSHVGGNDARCRVRR